MSDLTFVAIDVEKPCSALFWSSTTKKLYACDPGGFVTDAQEDHTTIGEIFGGAGVTTIDCSSGIAVNAGRSELPLIDFGHFPLESVAPPPPVNITQAPIMFGATTPMLDQILGLGAGAGIFGFQACMDASDHIWVAYSPGVRPFSYQVLLYVAYDPSSAAVLFQGSLISNDATVSYQNLGMYSFLAGGINYIWAAVEVSNINVPGFPGLTQAVAIWPADSAPGDPPTLTSFGQSEFSDDGGDTAYWADLQLFNRPIFDNVQFAYVISNGGRVYPGSNSTTGDGTTDASKIWLDDGSFTITQFDVSSGTPSIAQTWNLSNATEGRAYQGLFNPIGGILILFTSEGAVQTFDPATGLLTTVAPTETFAPFDPGDGVVWYTMPESVIGGQQNQVDTVNCFLAGMNTDTGQLAGNPDFAYITSQWAGFRRLNLGDFSVIDDHFPQNEWLSGDTNPADMRKNFDFSTEPYQGGIGTFANPSQNILYNYYEGGSFVFAPEMNALFWASGSTIYQLNWPSKGNCGGPIKKKNLRPTLWVT